MLDLKLHKPNISKTFIYQKYEILQEKNQILFWYLVDNKHQFCHKIELNLSHLKNLAKIEKAVFNLGLAEIPSYWKAFCSSKIIIQAGELNKEQIQFWQNLYIKGLGEFFYRNQIDFRNLIQIEVNYKSINSDKNNKKLKQNSHDLLKSDILEKNLIVSYSQDNHTVLEKIEKQKKDFENLENKKEIDFGNILSANKNSNPKILVPLGGGKDSLVTGQILQEKNLDFVWFMIEPYFWIDKQIEISKNPKKIFVYRNIENNFGQIKELILQNPQTKFYNGHVPISAVYAFTSVLISQIYGFEQILISQEKSSSYGNVEFLGEQINHQYSKSQEFEQNCQNYIHKFINPNLKYQSFLRDLYEIQIAQIFAQKCQIYFTPKINFYSCNKGLKEGFWCGKCAKCVFTFAILSPFVDCKSLQSIWQKDLFEQKELLQMFKDLIGKGDLKPWDCVGTFEETETALFLTRQKFLKNQQNLPFILKNLDLKPDQKYLKLLS